MAMKTRIQQDMAVTGSVNVSTAIAIGTTSAPDSKSVLDMVSTTKGMLPPRMTTVQRDAIASPTTGLTIYNTTTNKMNIYNGTSWVDVGSGSGSGINYISANNGNADAESTASGWTTFADGASLVDGTGGSPTATIARSTTLPLRGLASLLYTPGNLGDGVGYAFSIDSADKAKRLQGSFDYELSGTITEGDYQLYFYDVTNSILIQPDNYKLSGTSGTTYSHKFSFQTASNSTSYRLILWQSASTAITLKTDNFSIGPQNVSYTTPVSDWTSFTPTLTYGSGGATNVTNTAKYRRVGDSIQVEGTLTFSGASAAFTRLAVSLPSGLTIDTSKLSNSTAESQILGITNWLDSGAVNGGIGNAHLKDTSSVYILFSSKNAGTNTIDSSGFSDTAPVTWGANDVIAYSYQCPISGWSSSAAILASDSSEGRVVAFSAVKNGNKSIPGTATNTDIDAWTITADTHGSFNATTGVYTVQVPGWYHFVTNDYYQMGATATGQFNLYLKKNGTSGTSLNYHEKTGATNNAAYSEVTTALAYLNAGDTVRLVGYSSNQAVTYYGSSLSFFFGQRLSGNQSVMASETVAASYSTAAGQSISNATATVIDFGTKTYDTHGSVTTGGSWKFTAPNSGKYNVSALVLLASAAFTINTEQSLALRKNGVEQLMLASNTPQASGTYSIPLNGSCSIELLAGEYIDVTILQNSGGSRSLIAQARYNHIEITREGN